jgi:hypothetical protein
MRPTLFRFASFSRTGLFNRGRFAVVLPVVFVLLGTLLGPFASAQQPTPIDRVYNHSQAEVERALRDLQAYATAPLPALDGFVNGDSNTFDSYDNPQYEFRIRLSAPAPERTIVSVSARVTAWYSNAAPSQSRYVLLPSNGRLEKELLDRLAVCLETGTLRQPANSSPTATPTANGSTASAATISTPGISHSGVADSPAVKSGGLVAPPPVFSSSRPATPATEIAKVQAERESIEQEEKKLQLQISQLEADRDGRKYLADLAMVKTAQAPVFEQNNELSKVLFRADPEDEFEVTEARFGWVRVRLENQSQGWIKMDELQLPNEKDDTGDSADFGEPNEEVAPFTGNWALLKDKPTLFVVAQPKHALPQESLGQSQIEFAKRAFLDGYRAAAHSQEKIDGVAVVFLGDKAGMAAATLTEINRWNKGTISDKLFLERCFLSPPDAFRDIGKR